MDKTALARPQISSMVTPSKRSAFPSIRGTYSRSGIITWRTGTTSPISSGGRFACATSPSAHAAAPVAISKPAFRVDFNRFTTGQQFLGLKAIVLDNVWQDGSFVAERTAMAFFERMGQAARVVLGLNARTGSSHRDPRCPASQMSRRRDPLAAPGCRNFPELPIREKTL
jgi:hypothetical protein